MRRLVLLVLSVALAVSVFAPVAAARETTMWARTTGGCTLEAPVTAASTIGVCTPKVLTIAEWTTT